MAKKYYAVKNGRSKGIFFSWDECKKQIDGFAGAQYKGFQELSEAKAYLNGIVKTPAQKITSASATSADVLSGLVQGKTIIYVDGSYNSATNQFSYGMVVLQGETEETFSECFEDEMLATMNNVAGELKGSEAAMQYALDHGIKEITIVYDYEGIAKWCLGEWKTNKEGTKAYKAFYDSIKDRVKVNFVKVKGHSNDKYNDMVDVLAKRAVGIE